MNIKLQFSGEADLPPGLPELLKSRNLIMSLKLLFSWGVDMPLDLPELSQ